MKSTVLKKMIKEAVKEAIQEELKDILLEAVRSPKSSPITEQTTPTTPTNVGMGEEQKRQAYQQAMNETTLSLTSNDAQNFVPSTGFDPANGTLPNGSVGLDQIMNLMGK